jgi:hypothetical protein
VTHESLAHLRGCLLRPSLRDPSDLSCSFFFPPFDCDFIRAFSKATFDSYTFPEQRRRERKEKCHPEQKEKEAKGSNENADAIDFLIMYLKRTLTDTGSTEKLVREMAEWEFLILDQHKKNMNHKI